MEIKFLHITLQNFCGVKSLDIDLYDRTIIKGVNKAGKTTVKNAIAWVLSNKLSDGSAPDGIRPHTADGVDIDNIDIVVILTIEIDGKVIEIKKTQKQNWVTDRTTREQKFKGNVNEYEVNGIPKKEKDYIDYINQYIDPETFSFCTNPNVFLKLDTKGRRAKLFSLVGNVDTEVIDSDPRFEPLKNELKDGTVEELIARSTKAIKSYKEDLKTIPARIDELSMQVANIDVPALTKEQDDIKSQIKKEENNIANYNLVSVTYNELAQKLLEKKQELQKIEIDVRLKNQNAVAEANVKVQQLLNDIALTQNSLDSSISIAKRIASELDEHRKDVTNLRDLWDRESKSTFDENTLICPVCGSTFNEEKQEELRNAFAKHKTDTLVKIEKQGKDASDMVDECESRIAEATRDINGIKAKLDNLNTELEKAKKSTQNVKQIDYTSTKEYLKADKERDSIEKQMAAVTNVDADKQKCLAHISKLNSDLTRISTELAKADNNKAIEQRIADLDAEKLNVSQKIATQEMMVDLLKDYRKAKISMLTDRINAYFDIIKWKMFKEQINGDFAEVCIPTVEGTSYDGLLNHGNKILAEIDLCRAFQKANDVTCPIVIDDSESVDAWRIPVTTNQLIVLRRTDDKQLTVENLKGEESNGNS